MTWSYDVAQLATSTLYQVRLVIGDTDTSDQQLQDEEINALITLSGGVWATGIAACGRLIAKYSRQADRGVGQMRLSASQRAKAYQALRDELKYQMALGATPYAGGISVSDKKAQEQDTDRVAPAFWTGMEENPGMANPTDQPLDGTAY